MEHFDVAVVGGGIIGLATARAVLDRRPRANLVLLEKERRVAAHQSGRNSGVLHSGVYYRPGSLKARMTVAGRESMIRFCVEHGIAHEVCGKVVVATRPRELPRLRDLLERGRRNGVRVEAISTARLRAIEPHAAGIAAVHVADTGIVDFPAVCGALARLVEQGGGSLRLGTEVVRVVERHDRSIVETTERALEATVVVNCGGLHSDRIAGVSDVRIAPFRGEFLQLVPSREHLVRNLIYPVPDPAFPFLGAHLTRDVGGGVHAGPNAVPALAREGYAWSVLDLREVRELLGFRGYRAVAREYWRTGAAELARSLSRRLMTRQLARLVPEIRSSDLVRARSGVRAQALAANGRLLDDFVVRETEHAVHVVNAPSPAATAALEIGSYVAELAVARI